MTVLTETQCRLCSLELPKDPILDGENTFCCPGCKAVFNILSSKSQLDHFEEHPLFRQALESGLISNPKLLEKRSLESEHECEKLHLEIQEMWCPSCAEIIRLILFQEKGIKNCLVDYATDLASIEFYPRYISRERIFEKIAALGYKPSTLLLDGERKAVSFGLYMRFLIAAFFSLNIMMFSYPLYATYFDFDGEGVGPLFAWLSGLASLPVLGYSATPILKRAWTSLRVGLPGMELLVAMGVLSAFGLSLWDLWHEGTKVYFDSMTVIITFVLLGKIIEAKAKFSAKDSLFRLNRALPRRGRKRLDDGRYAYVPIKEIYPGDVVMALMGEKIVLDGCVIDGEGTCDESLMTGEASPISKRLGDIVLGGTCVTHGWIAYEVSAGVEQSALQRIIQLIEQDIGHKSHYMKMTDPIIRWFVPIILVIALFSALGVWFFYGNEAAIIRFVSVLLISCPCAIGIAAPLAEAHLMNGLTKLGAIVRNRGCLRFLGQETLFVFDKTGTLTEGHFQVLKGDEPLSSFELSIVKAVASHSNHPIARAIASFIESEPIHLTKIEEFAGKGLRGEYQNEIYYLGSAEFLQSQGIVPSSVSTEGLTSCVYFADHRKVITCFELGDQIKTNAPEVISQLPRSLLLSGDSKGAVEVVAKACGFEEFYWSRSPLLKREAIEGLKKKGEIVCMIGDGINDAPSLTSAHVGISVISATDISIQVSDILLTTDKLDVIPKIRKMAQKGRRVIRQNLFWAFFYNVIGVGLAVCGLLTPLFAAFAMVASSLIVLFNSQRIKVR